MSLKVDIKEREEKLMDDTRAKTPELVLVKPEDSINQQLISVQQESVKEETVVQHNPVEIVVDDVKDSDLILLENDQALTTSLKVAEYFGKQHSHVIRAVEKAIENVTAIGQSKNGPADFGFIAGTYNDAQDKERPMYYLNRDAFTFVVMGFTGERAAIWKWKYIQAFNRMEETIRKQQQEAKPMTLAQQLMVQAQFNIQMEERLNEQAKQLAQAQADIKQIKNNNNGMFLRHEMTDIRQQQQLDQHETDIQRLQRVISDKGPREEIKTLISAIVSQTAETIEPYDYHDAYKLFYQQVKDLVHIRLSTKLTNLKRLRTEQGWSKTKVDKLNYLDAIDSDPSIWDTVRQVTAHLWVCLNELKEV